MTTPDRTGPFRPGRLILLVIVCGLIGMTVALFDQSETLRRERPQPGRTAPVESESLAAG